MPLIYSIVDPFAVNQKVYLCTDDGRAKVIAMSNINEFKTTIPALCAEYHTNEVKLYGGTDYLTKIANSIQAENKIKYSQNILNIEVE